MADASAAFLSADLDTLAPSTPDPSPPQATPESGPGTVATQAPTPVDDRPVSDYERQLREENARYRQKFQPYERTFSSMSDQEAQFFLDLAQAWAQADDTTVLQRLDQIRQVLGTQEATPAPAPAVEPDDPNRPLTWAEFQALQDQQRQQTEQERQRRETEAQAAEVTRIARELGYDQTSDPLGFGQLTLAAQQAFRNNEARDLQTAMKVAHEKVQAYRQQIIDTYISAKKADAQRVPVASTSGIGARTDAGPPKNLDEARSAFEQMIDRLG